MESRVYGSSAYPGFDDTWEVFMFKNMDSGGERVRCFIRMDINCGLENGFTMVVLFIHQVDGYSTLLITRCQNSCMHMFPKHTLSTKFREQGRVNVQDFILVGGDQSSRYFPEESSQYNMCNTLILKYLGKFISLFEVVFIDKQAFNPCFCGNVQHTCTRFIANNQGYIYSEVFVKICDYFPGIAAFS